MHVSGKKNVQSFIQRSISFAVIEPFMLNNLIVLFFDFNVFWRRNDVTVLKANFHFSLMATKLYFSEKTRWDKVKCAKNILKKVDLSWRYLSLELWIFRLFVTNFLEHNYKIHIFISSRRIRLYSIFTLSQHLLTRRVLISNNWMALQPTSSVGEFYN